MNENRGGKRENAGRKKVGRERNKTKTFFLTEQEVKEVSETFKKIKKKHNYKHDIEAFLYLVYNYEKKENKDGK